MCQAMTTPSTLASNLLHCYSSDHAHVTGAIFWWIENVIFNLRETLLLAFRWMDPKANQTSFC